MSERLISFHVRGTAKEAEELMNALVDFVYSDANKTAIGTMQSSMSEPCMECENDPAATDPTRYD